MLQNDLILFIPIKYMILLKKNFGKKSSMRLMYYYIHVLQPGFSVQRTPDRTLANKLRQHS
jgi:hypothetical protein